ncbi:MAG: tetratricopeptide repeat protein, partial [Nitrospirota bacterium]
MLNPSHDNPPHTSSQGNRWQSIFLCLIFLWPLPAFGHQAGNLYRDALSAVEKQDFKTAQTLLEQAIQEFPGFPEAHHLYGLVEFQLTQQPERAISALQQAIRLNPNLAQA